MVAVRVARSQAAKQTKPAAKPASVCVQCHKTVTPQIVTDWSLSQHSKNEVDCSDCHGSEHKSASDVAKARIPTPETCATCHEQQVEQFKKGKHAHAWAAMKAMPTAHWQPMALMEGMKGCGGCHKIGLKSEADIRRCLSYPPSVLEGRGASTAGLSDLSHGLRPPAVGDVFRIQAWRALSAEAE
jgi:hypothetical protein